MHSKINRKIIERKQMRKLDMVTAKKNESKTKENPERTLTCKKNEKARNEKVIIG
jgi:hypothetical protein